MPSLAGLSCSKLTPEAKRPKPPGDAPEAAPSAAPSTTWTVTQTDAKEWFDNAGEGARIGQGVYGETRQAWICDRWLAIKKFTRPDPYEARTDAQKEVDNHLKVWAQSESHCQAYISEPATMTFEIDASEGTYTVQSLIRSEGLWLLPFDRLRKIDEGLFNPLMWQTSIAAKKDVCEAYGKMRACIAKAGFLHQDLHTNNVLCLTNYPWQPSMLAEFADDSGLLKDEKKDGIVIDWRVVDWGVAEDHPAKSPRKICWDDDFEPEDQPAYTSKLGYVGSDDACHTEHRDEITQRLFAFLFGEATPDCATATVVDDCVTDADVFAWVQKGFAEEFGEKVPQKLADATATKASADRKARNFGAGGSGGASA